MFPKNTHQICHCERSPSASLRVNSAIPWKNGFKFVFLTGDGEGVHIEASDVESLKQQKETSQENLDTTQLVSQVNDLLAKKEPQIKKFPSDIKNDIRKFVIDSILNPKSITSVDKDNEQGLDQQELDKYITEVQSALNIGIDQVIDAIQIKYRLLNITRYLSDPQIETAEKLKFLEKIEKDSPKTKEIIAKNPEFAATIAELHADLLRQSKLIKDRVEALKFKRQELTIRLKAARIPDPELNKVTEFMDQVYKICSQNLPKNENIGWISYFKKLDDQKTLELWVEKSSDIDLSDSSKNIIRAFFTAVNALYVLAPESEQKRKLALDFIKSEVNLVTLKTKAQPSASDSLSLVPHTELLTAMIENGFNKEAEQLLTDIQDGTARNLIISAALNKIPLEKRVASHLYLLQLRYNQPAREFIETNYNQQLGLLAAAQNFEAAKAAKEPLFTATEIYEIQRLPFPKLTRELGKAKREARTTDYTEVRQKAEEQVELLQKRVDDIIALDKKWFGNTVKNGNIQTFVEKGTKYLHSPITGIKFNLEQVAQGYDTAKVSWYEDPEFYKEAMKYVVIVAAGIAVTVATGGIATGGVLGLGLKLTTSAVVFTAANRAGNTIVSGSIDAIDYGSLSKGLQTGRETLTHGGAQQFSKEIGHNMLMFAAFGAGSRIVKGLTRMNLATATEETIAAQVVRQGATKAEMKALADGLKKQFPKANINPESIVAAKTEAEAAAQLAKMIKESTAKKLAQISSLSKGSQHVAELLGEFATFEAFAMGEYIASAALNDEGFKLPTMEEFAAMSLDNAKTMLLLKMGNAAAGKLMKRSGGKKNPQTQKQTKTIVDTFRDYFSKKITPEQARAQLEAVDKAAETPLAQAEAKSPKTTPARPKGPRIDLSGRNTKAPKSRIEQLQNQGFKTGDKIVHEGEVWQLGQINKQNCSLVQINARGKVVRAKTISLTEKGKLPLETYKGEQQLAEAQRTAKINQLNSEIQRLSELNEQLGKERKGLNPKRATILDQFNQAKSRLKQLTAEGRRLSEKTEKVEAELTASKGTQTKLENKLKESQTELETVQAEYRQVRERIDALKAQEKAAQKKVTYFKNQINTETDLTGREAENVAEIQTKITEYDQSKLPRMTSDRPKMAEKAFDEATDRLAKSHEQHLEFQRQLNGVQGQLSEAYNNQFSASTRVEAAEKNIKSTQKELDQHKQKQASIQESLNIAKGHQQANEMEYKDVKNQHAKANDQVTQLDNRAIQIDPEITQNQNQQIRLQNELKAAQQKPAPPQTEAQTQTQEQTAQAPEAATAPEPTAKAAPTEGKAEPKAPSEQKPPVEKAPEANPKIEAMEALRKEMIEPEINLGKLAEQKNKLKEPEQQLVQKLSEKKQQLEKLQAEQTTEKAKNEAEIKRTQEQLDELRQSNQFFKVTDRRKGTTKYEPKTDGAKQKAEELTNKINELRAKDKPAEEQISRLKKEQADIRGQRLEIRRQLKENDQKAATEVDKVNNLNQRISDLYKKDPTALDELITDSAKNGTPAERRRLGKFLKRAAAGGLAIMALASIKPYENLPPEQAVNAALGLDTLQPDSTAGDPDATQTDAPAAAPELQEKPTAAPKYVAVETSLNVRGDDMNVIDSFKPDQEVTPVLDADGKPITQEFDLPDKGKHKMQKIKHKDGTAWVAEQYLKDTAPPPKPAQAVPFAEEETSTTAEEAHAPASGAQLKPPEKPLSDSELKTNLLTLGLPKNLLLNTTPDGNYEYAATADSPEITAAHSEFNKYYFQISHQTVRNTFDKNVINPWIDTKTENIKITLTQDEIKDKTASELQLLFNNKIQAFEKQWQKANQEIKIQSNTFILNEVIANKELLDKYEDTVGRGLSDPKKLSPDTVQFDVEWGRDRKDTTVHDAKVKIKIAQNGNFIGTLEHKNKKIADIDAADVNELFTKIKTIKSDEILKDLSKEVEKGLKDKNLDQKKHYLLEKWAGRTNQKERKILMENYTFDGLKQISEDKGASDGLKKLVLYLETSAKVLNIPLADQSGKSKTIDQLLGEILDSTLGKAAQTVALQAEMPTESTEAEKPVYTPRRA